MQPCLNPNCSAHGKPHPNCKCYDHMADGGKVYHFCDTNGMHENSCEYYKDGGEVKNPDSKDTKEPQTPQPEQPSLPGTDEERKKVQDSFNNALGFADGGEVGFKADAVDAAPSHGDLGFAPDDQQAALQAKHGSFPDQATAFVEGAAEGVAGPLAPMAERALGVSPEGIRGRAEANPVAHGAGQATGLVGSAVAGTGELALLGKVGSAAMKVAGVEGAAAKMAVKLGVENALFTLGDEFSKAVKQDPSTVQAAALHVGLSGLLGAAGGAALGKVSDAWINKIGPKAEGFMNDFIDAMKGEVKPAEMVAGAEIPSSILDVHGNPMMVPGPEVMGEMPLKSSGTKAGEKFVEYLSKAASETVGGAVGGLAGRSTGVPGAGMLGAYLGHRVIKPMVDKFMPAIVDTLLNAEPSIYGLKASFDTMDSILSGIHAMDKAADGLFKQQSTRALDSLIPDKERLTKLEAHLAELEKNPDKMMDISGQVSHYMPFHAGAMASTAQNAVNYLNAQKPRNTQPSPLDKPMEPSPVQEAAYRKTLEIAESPLTVLSRIYKGQLQPKDLTDLSTLYPAVSAKMKQTVGSAMMDHMAKGNTVPYKMRHSLSLLMGQPLDSTFVPSNMMAAQGTYVPRLPPEGSNPSKPKRNTSKLGNAAKAVETNDQKRQEALYKP